MSYFQPGNLVQADFWVYEFCWLCQLFDKPVLNGKSNDVSDMLSIWRSVLAVARAQRSHCMLRVGLSSPGPHGQSHCAHSTVPPRNCVTVWLLKEVSNFLNVDNIAHVHHGQKVNSQGEHYIPLFCPYNSLLFWFPRAMFKRFGMVS